MSLRTWLSAYATLPLPVAPPELAALDPFRMPIGLVGGDDFVTSFTIDGDFVTVEYDFVPYPLVLRLTSLESVPEPAVMALMGLAIACLVLRSRRSS